MHTIEHKPDRPGAPTIGRELNRPSTPSANSDYSSLLHALTEARARYDSAYADLEPLEQRRQEYSTKRTTGLIPFIGEAIYDHFKKKKYEPQYKAALLDAMGAERGVDQATADAESYAQQVAKMQADAEAEAQAAQMSSLYQGAGMEPGQAALYGHGGKLPEQAKTSYRDFVDPNSGDKYTYTMNPDGTKGQRIGMSDKAPAPEGEDDGFDFDDSAKLRKELSDATHGFSELTDSYGRIQASAKDPSAAGDLALIFNYMKMLDPGSAVRETEFANAQNSAGVPDRVRAQWNAALNGQRLADPQRSDFVNRADRLYQTATDLYQRRRTEYDGLATRLGYDPKQIFIDQQVLGGQPDRAPAGSSPDAAVDTKTINGKTYVKQGGQWYETGN